MNTLLLWVLVAAIPLFSGCQKPQEPKSAAGLPAATVEVRVVERKTRAATEEVVGTLRARLQSVIEAKVSGKIERMLAVPGRKVSRGDLLATVEAGEVQSRLEQALALREQAGADLKRLALLFQQNILSQSEYDAAQSRFRVADASVKEGETLLGYTRVTAPFDGTITRKRADVGDLAAPGKPLLEMEDSTTLRIESDAPEGVLGRLALGDKLPVRIAGVDYDLEGVVSEIAPAADPGSRTSLVKLDLPPAKGLHSGQFGRVSMPVGETSALRAPASAVLQRGQMEVVFVSTGNRAQLRLVKTGKQIGAEVEIVSGLDAGEWVVVQGAAGLKDGQPVLPKP